MSLAPQRLHAWLAGRSIARELAAPVADRGGFRVDTASASETRRWVFPAVCDGLVALGEQIEGPGFALKLCDSVEALRAVLPPRWRINAPCWFMARDGAGPRRPVPQGYRLDLERTPDRVACRIVDGGGDLAASGYAGVAAGALVFDRIVVQPDHQRRGLGAALMGALEDEGWCGDRLLVATEAGRALYETLGWRVIAPYASATIDPG